jgi:hypothetical protein
MDHTAKFVNLMDKTLYFCIDKVRSSEEDRNAAFFAWAAGRSPPSRPAASRNGGEAAAGQYPHETQGTIAGRRNL